MRKTISLIFLTIIVGFEAFAQESAFNIEKGHSFVLPSDIHTGHVTISMSAVKRYDANPYAVQDWINDLLKEHAGSEIDSGKAKDIENLREAFKRMDKDEFRKLLEKSGETFTYTKNFTSPEELAKIVGRHAKMGDISVTVERSIRPAASRHNLLSVVLKQREQILEKGKRVAKVAKNGAPAIAAAVVAPFLVPDPVSASETLHMNERELPPVPAAE